MRFNMHINMNRYIKNLPKANLKQLHDILVNYNSYADHPDDEGTLTIGQIFFIQDLMKQKKKQGQKLYCIDPQCSFCTNGENHRQFHQDDAAASS